MADLLIRDVDPEVLAAFRLRAEFEGVSVEDIVRRVVREATLSPRQRFIEAAAASRERTRREQKGPPSDSTDFIRRARDAS